MAEPPYILIISRDRAIRNVVEQVSRVGGYRPVSEEGLADAEAILSQRGPERFALVVTDLRVLSDSDEEALDKLPALLQAWAKPPFTVPCLYLGSLSQKYGTLAAQTAPVPFLTIPFSAYEFGEAMQGLVGADERLKSIVGGQASVPAARPHGRTHQWLPPPFAPNTYPGKPPPSEPP